MRQHARTSGSRTPPPRRWRRAPSRAARGRRLRRCSAGGAEEAARSRNGRPPPRGRGARERAATRGRGGAGERDGVGKRRRGGSGGLKGGPGVLVFRTTRGCARAHRERVGRDEARGDGHRRARPPPSTSSRRRRAPLARAFAAWARGVPSRVFPRRAPGVVTSDRQTAADRDGDDGDVHERSRGDQRHQRRWAPADRGPNRGRAGRRGRRLERSSSAGSIRDHRLGPSRRRRSAHRDRDVSRARVDPIDAPVRLSGPGHRGAARARDALDRGASREARAREVLARCRAAATAPTPHQGRTAPPLEAARSRALPSAATFSASLRAKAVDADRRTRRPVAPGRGASPTRRREAPASVSVRGRRRRAASSLRRLRAARPRLTAHAARRRLLRARAERSRSAGARARNHADADLARRAREGSARARDVRANATGAEAAVFSQDFPRRLAPPPRCRGGNRRVAAAHRGAPRRAGARRRGACASRRGGREGEAPRRSDRRAGGVVERSRRAVTRREHAPRDEREEARRDACRGHGLLRKLTGRARCYASAGSPASGPRGPVG